MLYQDICIYNIQYFFLDSSSCTYLKILSFQLLQGIARKLLLLVGTTRTLTLGRSHVSKGTAFLGLVDVILARLQHFNQGNLERENDSL
jgi:hypothetical protein